MEIEKRLERYEQENQLAHQRLLDEIVDGNEAINYKIDVVTKKVDIASTITSVMKWAAGMLVTIIVILLTVIASYSRLQYLDSKKASEMNIHTYEMMSRYQEQLDSIMKLQRDFLQFKNEATVFYDKEYSKQASWTKGIYDSLIIPNNIRSKRNERKINNLLPRVKSLEEKYLN